MSNSNKIIISYRKLVGDDVLKKIGEKYNKTQSEINQEIMSKKFYDGKVFGIGENDLGKRYNVKWNTEHKKVYIDCIHKYEYFAYTLWTKILLRITNTKNYPNYTDCTIDKRWLSFANFVEDLSKIPGYDLWLKNLGKDEIHLDKDIKNKGNREYSLDNCMFVPQRINYLFVKSDRKRGECPIGVYMHRKKYQVAIKSKGQVVTLGTFNNKHDAFLMYKFNKELIIQQMAKEMYNSGEIYTELYECLMKYKVEEDD